MFDKIRPLIFKLDPELAHSLAIKALKTNLFLKQKISEDSNLKCTLFGKEIKNPIGIAAGFDKDAEVYNSLFNLGFGFVEVGTVTPLKQYGNKKPNSSEIKALLDLISNLEKCTDNMNPEDIQTEIYTVGKNNGYKENLREWFKLIYQVVFGVENGPRLGFFISFFGRKEMIKLIKQKLN